MIVNGSQDFNTHIVNNELIDLYFDTYAPKDDYIKFNREYIEED